VRARRSSASAALLLDAGDATGACNRAYYAMFDAVRAALLVAVPAIQSESIKTHSGLISSFSLHLIKPELIAVEFGKSLARIDHIRRIADYSDEEVDPQTSASAVEQAKRFVEAISVYLDGYGT
jgi:uncharacterized protein (UPF0332 family)